MKCPQCTSQKTWKDGVRKTTYGDVQRYLCCVCGYRFSDSKVKVGVIEKSLVFPDSVHDFGKLGLVNLLPHKKSFKNLSFAVGEDVGSHSVSIVGKGINGFLRNNKEHRVCVSPERKAKNLVEVEPLREGPAGATKQDAKGIILEHLWTLQKQGYKSSTIKLRSRILRVLCKRGADLHDPESVKETIAKIEASQGYKFQLSAAYNSFLSTQGLKWNPPNYRQTQKLPFIPQEIEIDTLIAAMGTKGATFLQILKETGMRKGEANKLCWKDIDTERNTITVNNPEKNSNARTIKISNKLVAMLKSLSVETENVFTNPTYVERELYLKRKRLASKFQNPRLLNISFHTFRHWKATMEYHKTRDILHVKQLLGHKDINNTLIYTQLVDFESDDYHVKTAKTLKEACELAEVGFEYFTTIEEVQVFRKRK